MLQNGNGNTSLLDANDVQRERLREKYTLRRVIVAALVVDNAVPCILIDSFRLGMLPWKVGHDPLMRVFPFLFFFFFLCY